MNWIAIAKAILMLIPAIIEAIKAIEAAFPNSGQGAEKLALIREIIEPINEEAQTNWPFIEKAISAIVNFFNKVGIFKK